MKIYKVCDSELVLDHSFVRNFSFISLYYINSDFFFSLLNFVASCKDDHCLSCAPAWLTSWAPNFHSINAWWPLNILRKGCNLGLSRSGSKQTRFSL